MLFTNYFFSKVVIGSSILFLMGGLGLNYYNLIILWLWLFLLSSLCRLFWIWDNLFQDRLIEFFINVCEILIYLLCHSINLRPFMIHCIRHLPYSSNIRPKLVYCLIFIFYSILWKYCSLDCFQQFINRCTLDLLGN